MRVPTTPAHLFFLRKKTPASHRARVGTSTVSLARGANREVKERVKGVCVCVCFLPIYSGRQVRWMYQPGSHRFSHPRRILCANDLIVLHLLGIYIFIFE